MILLNIESSRPSWLGLSHEKVEQCISLARGVIDEFEQAGIPYGFCTDAFIRDSSNRITIIPPSIGAYHYNRIVEDLARIINSLILNFEDLIRDLTRFGGSYTTCVLITPAVLDPYISSLNALSRQAAKTILISLDETNFEHLPDILKFKGGRG